MAGTKKENVTHTAQYLGRQSRSGTAVARLMRGEPAEEDKPAPQKRKCMKTKFTNPSEFLAGPNQPGRITHGPRRFNNNNKDSVARMLCDSFIMGEKDAIVVDKKVQCKQMNSKSHLTHLTNVCDVTEEPAPFRPQVHPHPNSRRTEVPQCFKNDGNPAQTQEKAGKRQFKTNASMNLFLTRGETNAESAAAEEKRKCKVCKPQKSIDVLNLWKYDPATLHEVKIPNIQRGPRRYEAPEMPPPRKPQIRMMKVTAREEHDVLGTGLVGKNDEVKYSRKAPGTAHPSQNDNSLFGGVFLEKGKKSSTVGTQGRAPSSGHRGMNNGTPDLLRYYDPTLDGPMQSVQRRKNGNRSNIESNHDMAIPASGKGKGLFYERYTRQTRGILEFA